jgi:dethiobiotin synthetase/adenosylmethionine--8-amino-7-oxononanoate aminotransferase
VLLQVAHAPGLELSRALLSGPLGAGWASRVFFSDDGSTAVSWANAVQQKEMQMLYDQVQHQHG